MVEAKKNESLRWWWFDSRTKASPKRSPWLQATLAELDEKTKAMLQLMEEDADSFAQRAEMYYKKRPELISMMEDIYRTHRSLAERYDQLKTELGSPLLSSLRSSSPLPLTKHCLEKSLSSSDTAYDSYSEACGPEESDESEVDDPEEEQAEVDQESESETEKASSDGGGDEELMRLKEEVRRLEEEKGALQEQLKQKDEEKRDVIRQLSLAMDLLREDNVKLRDCLVKKTPKKAGQLVYNKLKDNFLGRLFTN